MHYVVVALVLGLSLLLLGWAGPRLRPRGDARQRSGPPLQVAEAAVAPGSRAEVEARLKRLAESPAPEPKLQGAMCYEPRAIFSRAEYVCPKDGAHTQYSSELAEEVDRIRYLRQQVKQLPGLDASLDEHEFCKQCNPGLDPQGLKGDPPELTLVVRYLDPKSGKVVEHRTRGVSGTDIQLLREFLSGSLEHGLEGPDTEPLKKHLDRLKVLLGADLPDPKTGPKPTPGR